MGFSGSGFFEFLGVGVSGSFRFDMDVSSMDFTMNMGIMYTVWMWYVVCWIDIGLCVILLGFGCRCIYSILSH